MNVEALALTPRDDIPNHPRYPALVYRGVIDAPSAQAFEGLFELNDWPPQWRDGIFDFHHYHTEGHEALGVARGTARVLLGGPDGCELTLAAGDAVLLPVGTGHCRLSASDDFLVVGAYPPGQHADICRAPPTDEMRARIAALPSPGTDPVGAPDGLRKHWPVD